MHKQQQQQQEEVWRDGSVGKRNTALGNDPSLVQAPRLCGSWMTTTPTTGDPTPAYDPQAPVLRTPPIIKNNRNKIWLKTVPSNYETIHIILAYTKSVVATNVSLHLRTFWSFFLLVPQMLGYQMRAKLLLLWSSSGTEWWLQQALNKLE